MIIASETLKSKLTAPLRQIEAKVELYKGSTLTATFKHNDFLKSFKVEKIGEKNKFFGFGICQKLELELNDKDRAINITKANSLKIRFDETENISPYPLFYVEEVKRDENTNTISIVAYDKLYSANAWKFSDLTLNDSYTFMNLASKCALKLGINSIGKQGIPTTDTCFDTVVNADNPANFGGEEDFRQILNAIAEATQTIYYIDRSNSLNFKRLDRDGDPVLEISKKDYFTLTTGEAPVLGAICHATALGDNLTATSTAVTGVTQYIRNNPLYELRTDIATLLDNAIAAIEGTIIPQFTCSWRGNFLLEIGDKISIVTKDNNSISSYVLNDSILYNGGLKEETQWSYEKGDGAETASNPTTLGEKLNQTFARVDKANREIELLVNETTANRSNISSLQMDVSSINASVISIEKNTNEKINNTSNEIEEIKRSVDAKMSAEDVQIQITTAIEQGVTKVETTTGFTFNDEGLRINKSGSEIENIIDNTGMYVKRGGTDVLTADNTGVQCINVTAQQYLIIGGSRFEKYGGRTGCFWIG